MKIANRNIDIELTNRCNATCDFCPREKTPKQGFMAWDVFEKSVERILALGNHGRVFFTGLGEPMLHPRFLEYVRYGIAQGLNVGICSNGSRLTPQLTADLLESAVHYVDEFLAEHSFPISYTDITVTTTILGQLEQNHACLSIYCA